MVKDAKLEAAKTLLLVQSRHDCDNTVFQTHHSLNINGCKI
ncbi:MAG: hypothetical protein AABW54_04950 [Candidatus Micrarchaeota archaeon]